MDDQAQEVTQPAQQTKILVCVDCKEEFEFTPEEQKFFAEKGFNDPIRDKKCRRRRKQEKLKFAARRNERKTEHEEPSNQGN